MNRCGNRNLVESFPALRTRLGVVADTKSPIADQAEQKEAPKAPPALEPTAVSPSGRRQAFLNLKRGLTDEELTNTGTQKLLLDMLECAEAERDEFKRYIQKYHEANTRASVLDEKIKTNTTNEIMFAVMIGVGGTVVGLTPVFAERGNGGILAGALCAGVGVALIAGGAIARIKFK